MYRTVLVRPLKIAAWSAILVLSVYTAFAVVPMVLINTEYSNGTSSLTHLFGILLFDSFSYMAVGIPVYLFIAAVLLMQHSVSLKLIVGWTSSILPYLFLAISLKEFVVYRDYLQSSLFFCIALTSALLCLLLLRRIPAFASTHGFATPAKKAPLVALPMETANSAINTVIIVDESINSVDLNPSSASNQDTIAVQEYTEISGSTAPTFNATNNTAMEDAILAEDGELLSHDDSHRYAIVSPENTEFSDERIAKEEALFADEASYSTAHSATEFPLNSEESRTKDTQTEDDRGIAADEGARDEKTANPATQSTAYQKSYVIPTTGVLEFGSHRQEIGKTDGVHAAAERLIDTLKEFDIAAKITGIQCGSTITRFEVLPAHGIRLGKIGAISDNIALRLAAERVRIVAPIPGKEAVGIEIPNKQRKIVHFGDLIEGSSRFWDASMRIPIILGEKITGEECIIDLTKTPHLLIAGATGSGKSVCVNTLISSILYRCPPEAVKLILIDPKIVELNFYNDIPHLLTPVVTNAGRSYQVLRYCLHEMEQRYYKLETCGVRDIASYNQEMEAQDRHEEKLAYIVVIIDEFADLMMSSGKDIESLVSRLTAMSRAIGIHLVLATQRPSTDVITGLIKANVPSRIAFMVSSKVDSRIIIDTGGAESLLGRGDMLFSSSWESAPSRIQGSYLNEEEVRRVVSEVKRYGPAEYIDEEIFFDAENIHEGEYDEAEDPLLKDAINLVLQAQKASTSFLQRKFKIGYNRAARLIEAMEEQEIIGPLNGAKPRSILLKNK